VEVLEFQAEWFTSVLAVGNTMEVASTKDRF